MIKLQNILRVEILFVSLPHWICKMVIIQGVCSGLDVSAGDSEAQPGMRLLLEA